MARSSDNPLRRLISEIHRRSLWQVLGIYVVASWAVLGGVGTLGDALGLPDWFPRLAFGLLVVGLPIVLATAFVQEGGPGHTAEGGEAGDTAQVPGPSRFLTWRNALLAGVGGLAIWGVLATGVLIGSSGLSVMRPAPETPGAPLLAVLPDFDVLQNSRTEFAISRDGSLIAARSQTGSTNLLVKRTDELEFTEIPGTERASYPEFSPDGQWLAFRTPQGLSRVQVSGGPVLPVTTSGAAQLHWGTEDLIVFSGDGLYAVAPSGGEPRQILSPDSLNPNPSRPFLLPDGETVFFEEGGSEESGRLMMVDIGSGSVTDLGIAGQDPRYVSTGHLLYGHLDQALMAVPFDLESRRVTGDPFTVLPNVRVDLNGATQFQVSDAGTALYLLATSSPIESRRLVEVSFEGAVTALPLEEGAFWHPRYSPDGRHIAYELGNAVWIYDSEVGTNVRLSAVSGRSPAWSFDGRFVYFGSPNASGSLTEAYRRLADLSQEEELIYSGPNNLFAVSSSPFGNGMLMDERVPQSFNWDLLLMMDGSDEAIFTPYLQADWNEYDGVISPRSGSWVAYVSDESGEPEVYVRSFPEPLNAIRVSTGGGVEPVWSHDERAIYYRSLEGRRVMQASIISDDPLELDEPRVVIADRWLQTLRPGARSAARNWDLHPDGEKFLFVTDPGAVAEPETVSPIWVMTDFFEELRRLAPEP